jgi:hypothetical protein
MIGFIARKNCRVLNFMIEEEAGDLYSCFDFVVQRIVKREMYSGS